MSLPQGAVPALTLRGLRQSAQRGGALHRGPLGSPPLAGLDLSVAPGEVGWVVGASESLAALCRILAGAEPSAGSIAVAGRDVTRRPRKLRSGIARQLVVLGPESGPVDADLVAAVAATGPSVIVLDGSAAGASGHDVLAMLGQVARELAIGVLVLDRELPGPDVLADVVHVLCAGRVVELLGPGDLAEPMHPFVRLLAASDADLPAAASDVEDEYVAAASGLGWHESAAPRSDERGRWSPRADLPELAVVRPVAGGCVWRGSCELARERCAQDAPALERPLGATHTVACHFPLLRPRAAEWPFPGAEQSEPAAGAARPFADEPTAQEFAEE